MLAETRDSYRLQVELGKLLPPRERKELLARIREVSRHVESPHNASHVLTFVVECLRRRDIPGVLVEAGCFKGSSAAKFSIVASMLGKRLFVFDSFQGLPANEERHSESILGHSVEGWFTEGAFAGSLEEVRSNVERFGEIDACEFVPGWFEDTMPGFSEQVVAGYLDVDLASSTRTCLEHLHPLLAPGGVLVSQDGDFPLVIDALREWQGSNGVEIEGLGERKMLLIPSSPGQ